MRLPMPHLFETALDEVSEETRASVRRFIEARPGLVEGISHLPTSPSAVEESRAASIGGAIGGLTRKQVEYDRYFGVQRSELRPAEALARAALQSLREVSINAAEGHSLSPVEEHLFSVALREGLAMLCPHESI
jgi:hypothetical protein